MSKMKSKNTGKSRLYLRMARSYVVVTLIAALIMESLAYIPLTFLIKSFVQEHIAVPLLQNQALLYANASANLLHGSTVDPELAACFAQEACVPMHMTGASLHIPYISTLYPDNRPEPFVLLVAPTGQILESSYPTRYPLHSQAEHVLLDRAPLVARALRGKAGTISSNLAMGSVTGIAVPVWNSHYQVVGAIYIQAPLGSFLSANAWLALLLVSGLLLLVLTIPIGGIFGFLTTHRLVRRIRSLAQASVQFASGDHSQQVPIATLDEMGQLEVQFNQMVVQLTENTARQQTLIAQNARLEERARISRDLHDAISQDLFSLRMLAHGLRTAVEVRTDLPTYVETLEDVVTHMQREMRALLLELRPGKLDELGLVSALQDMAHNYNSRVGITVETMLQPVPLSLQAEHVLFRIAQEAVSNAVRHSEATTITLNLHGTEEGSTFSITDDGKGFVLAQEQQHGGFGLQLMQERIQELQGTFTLTSQPGKGTCISVNLPLATGEKAWRPRA